jgi:hypothetical protein
VSRERLGDAGLGFAYPTGCGACKLMLAVTTIDTETRSSDREKPNAGPPALAVPVRRGVPADANPHLAAGLGGSLTAIGREYVREYRSSHVEITSDFTVIRRTSAPPRPVIVATPLSVRRCLSGSLRQLEW